MATPLFCACSGIDLDLSAAFGAKGRGHMFSYSLLH
jgi:hypothetical protein